MAGCKAPSCGRPTGVRRPSSGDRLGPGDLRNKIVVESFTNTPDGEGGFTEAWATNSTLWAMIQPRLGNERFFGQRIEENITHIITTRYVSGLDTSMRISFDSRYFQIKSIISPMENKEYLMFLCVEGEGT